MTIIGFCNPLLDISISNHPDIQNLLTKYELRDNDIILADWRHENLIEDMKMLGEVEYTAGGAGLNSLRCAQLLLDEGSCRIVGSIGTDPYGQILIEKSLQAGLITTSLQMTSTKATGKCACIIHGPFRSLVAFLDAARDFDCGHLETVRDEIAEADYLYITGFFYSVSPKSMRKILDDHKISAASAKESKIIFNLSATFVAEMITDEDFDSIMKSVYILIGNSDEFEHLRLRTLCGIESKSIQGFATNLKQKYPQSLIIITQGSDPILFFSDSFEEIPVPAVEKVVDTNGAGDAFIGGILGGLERKFSLFESIRIGCFMSGRVISKSGIHPPSREELEEFIKTQLLNSNFNSNNNK